MHESQMHADNCFVTLTYDEEHLPQRGSLRYRDFQLFMKRLRKHFGRTIRFYMCGEYGEQFLRPHFHACLFGVDFSDRVYDSLSDSGGRLYRSETLGRLWPAGRSLIGDVTFESAAYVARYVMKKVTGPLAELHYERCDVYTGELYSVEPEFCHMSLKPGIGASWLRKFSREAFVYDGVIVNGVKSSLPRYYDNLMRQIDDDAFAGIDVERYRSSLKYASEGTPERLAVREHVATARLAFKKRSL